MNLDWLLSPVAFYSGAAVCLVTSLALFVNIKVEMARARSRAEVSEGVAESEKLVVRGLKDEVEKLRESMTRLEEAPSGHPIGVGISLTKRGQVLRMHRRGEAVPSIAAALETPSNEIALLLKVHALMNRDETKAG
jgi:hypothetical protein